MYFSPGRHLLALWLLCASTLLLSAQTLPHNGTVTDQESGEALYGATIFLPRTSGGVTTNAYGYFALDAERGDTLIVSMLGYRSDTLTTPSASTVEPSASLQISLAPIGTELSTVEVKAQRNDAAFNSTPGLVRLDLRQIEEMPVLLGEKDAFKALQLQAGVSNPREGFGGLYVRGGSPDQNLILLDGATVYNAFHLFGFLSVFNADALSSVDLYKGGFPARYGGRVASVVDIRMKEGNRKKWSGAGGIGLFTSRLTLEGPLDKKGRASVLVSGRRTYLDLLLGLFTPSDEKTVLNFGDLNAKLNYQLSENDRLYISAYTGRDNFGSRFSGDSHSTRDAFNWGNRTLTARYNRRLGQRAFLNVTAIGSGFDFRVENQETVRDSLYSLAYTSRINDYGLQADLDWFPHADHTFRFGAGALRHDFNLGTVARQVEESNTLNQDDEVVAGEYYLYAEDEYSPSPRLSLNGGLRLSYFVQKVGAKTYNSVEPRLNLSYQLTPAVRVKGGVNYTQQYLHLLSNSGPGLPTSLWIPATDSIPPQKGWQYAVGAGWKVNDALSFDAEVYYRSVEDLIGYDNGASFLLLEAFDNPEGVDRVNILDNVTTGEGKAYGLELAGRYRSEKLDLNLAYTLARSETRLQGVNEFTWFAASQDRRHDLNLNGSWRFHRRLTLSFAWTYGSGAPTTLPRGMSFHPDLPGSTNVGAELFSYGSRNNARMRAVHRMDLGLRWRRSPNWGTSHWEFGLYNAYARANPFYVTVETDDEGKSAVYQTALFPIVPSLSYSFKF